MRDLSIGTVPLLGRRRLPIVPGSNLTSLPVALGARELHDTLEISIGLIAAETSGLELCGPSPKSQAGDHYFWRPLQYRRILLSIHE